MTRLAPLATCVLIAALSACATSPEVPPPEAGVEPPAPRVTLPTPKVDWPAERDRISRALGGRTDLSLAVATDGQLRIMLPGSDAFARDDATPKAALRSTLDKVATVLGATPETEIIVIGHTDSVGSEVYNLQLSIRRAEAAVEYLRSQGIALSRLVADGRGEADPITDNGTESGRVRNRRLEIVVRPFK